MSAGQDLHASCKGPLDPKVFQLNKVQVRFCTYNKGLSCVFVPNDTRVFPMEKGFGLSAFYPLIFNENIWFSNNCYYCYFLPCPELSECVRLSQLFVM